MNTIPGGLYRSVDGSYHNANGDPVADIKFISSKKLDRTRIINGNVYAPSDDGATYIPAELRDVLVDEGLMEAPAERSVEEDSANRTVVDADKDADAAPNVDTKRADSKSKPIAIKGG